MSQRVARLHRAGLKATGPRMVILAAVEQDHTHPTAEHLYDMLRREHPSLVQSPLWSVASMCHVNRPVSATVSRRRCEALFMS